MPLEPNQVPCAGQRRPLPTSRTPSTIPKAGAAAGGTWVYPSPQMFFNALARKGKGDGVKEEDMESVVHAHNCECVSGERRERGRRGLWGSLSLLSPPPPHPPSPHPIPILLISPSHLLPLSPLHVASDE